MISVDQIGPDDTALLSRSNAAPTSPSRRRSANHRDNVYSEEGAHVSVTREKPTAARNVRLQIAGAPNIEQSQDVVRQKQPSMSQKCHILRISSKY